MYGTHIIQGEDLSLLFALIIFLENKTITENEERGKQMNASTDMLKKFDLIYHSGDITCKNYKNADASVSAITLPSSSEQLAPTVRLCEPTFKLDFHSRGSICRQRNFHCRKFEK